MKRSILILTIAFLATISFGQIEGKWRIGTNLQYDTEIRLGSKSICYPTNCIMAYPYPEPNKLSKLNLTAGINVGYGLTKKIELVSGLNYVQRHYSNYEYPIVCFTGFAEGGCYLYYYPLTRRYLELPMLARYYFLPGNFKIHAELGQSLMSNISNITGDIKLNGRAGIGVDYFMNRFQLGLSINYRRSLISIRYDYSFKNIIGAELKMAFTL